MSTSIEWTQRPGAKGETWNPLRAEHRETGRKGWHCEHVSEGCRNCYAKGMNRGRGTGLDYLPAHRQEGGAVRAFLDERALALPLRWRAPRTIFVCSMTDLFGAWHSDADIDRVFGVMALSPQHTFIVLTKRPERMREYVGGLETPERIRQVLNLRAVEENGAEGPVFSGVNWPLPNVWLGVSVENQATADERGPLLLDTPAAVRLVSYEPALGAVEFRPEWLVPQINSCQQPITPSIVAIARAVARQEGLALLDWIICGGESGPGARPMHSAWARSVRDQCAAAGVPFFFKQWGAWGPAPAETRKVWPVGRPEKAQQITAPVLQTGDRILQADGSEYLLGAADGRGSWAGTGAVMRRVGKRAAGRLLDGREHNEFPSKGTP
jgi:protein gp37